MGSRLVWASVVIVAVIAAILVYLWTYEDSLQSNALLDRSFMIVGLGLVGNGSHGMYYSYLAATPQQQQQGYMNATGIGDCNGHSPCLGMLFVFQNYSNLCFWMENTRIPLEQTWLTLNNSAYTATYTYNATPYDTTPICHNGAAVLETAPGRIVSGTKMYVRPIG
jgi:uncharacterized membrane protein (UPF0127 family)